MKDELFATGLRTILLGIVLYIIELLLLPVFANWQKNLVDGQGFYTNIMEYTKMQPYPLIFVLTGLIIVIGIALCVKSYLNQKKSAASEK